MTAFRTLSFALLFGFAASHPAAGQAMPADVGAGRVAWFDLSTTDLPKSKAFYGQLLGWQFAAVEGSNLAVEIVADGTPIGTLRTADGALSVFNGVVYVQVTDLPGTVARAKALGGTVAPGFPFDLPAGRGAIALVVDPGGHPIGLYSRTPLAGSPPGQVRRSMDEAAIREARVTQNRAMASGDADAAAAFWTEDVTLRRGLGQTVSGRDAYRALVAAPNQALVYWRTPDTVAPSAKWPLAYESGTWAGHAGRADGPVVISGRYGAQWVKRGGRWLIRSETFVALDCSGDGCAASAVP